MPLSLVQLRTLCRQSGITGCSTQSREELTHTIQKHKSKITVSSLKEVCCKSGMKGCSKLTKQELLQRCLEGKPSVVKKKGLPSPAAAAAATPVYQSQALCEHRKEMNGYLPVDSSCTLPYNFSNPEKNTSKEHLLWLASWYKPSITLEHTTTGLCQLINQLSVSKSWLQKQKIYIEQHSDWGLLTDYTRHGDRVLNQFLRGNLKAAIQQYSQSDDTRRQLQQSRLFGTVIADIATPDFFTVKGRKLYANSVSSLKAAWPMKPVDSRYFTDSFFRLLFSTVAERLQQMIQQAPKLEKDVILFRGDRNWQHLKPGHLNTVKGFYSTSLSPSIAIKFGAKDTGGLISRILVRKGTPCLAVLHSHSPEESEVLFHGVQLQLSSCDTAPLAYFEAPWTPTDISLCHMVASTTVCTVELID